MVKRRKICVFTGTRAEYGLLNPLMREIQANPALALRLIVSGMHLSAEYGLTYKYIEKDGIPIHVKVKVPLTTNTPEGLATAIASGITRLTKVIRSIKPDIMVILGDRFEAFSCAVSCMVSKVPIAHLQGGEATFGLLDEAIRHSITKMSHLHFTSHETYRQRIIQLGERPSKVFTTGAIGIDNIRSMKLLDRKTLQKNLGFTFRRRNLLITFHPVTLERNTAAKQFKNLLGALDALEETRLIFTKANADPGGQAINTLIEEYVAKHLQKAIVFTSMGQLNYLSCMRLVDGVVGNSSSGIIEAPSFGIGTINTGDRQAGRLRAESVIDCAPAKESIAVALKKLYTPAFQAKLKTVRNPYGEGKTAKKIVAVLATCNLKDILKKEFFDIKVLHTTRNYKVEKLT